VTRYVVDAPAAVELARAGYEVPDGDELLAPTLIRSQTLSLLHEAVGRGELEADVAEELLERIWKLPLRLLGDAVLRRLAWRIARERGWSTTYDAEYVALTKLQADALVTLDEELARRVEGLVETAPLHALGVTRAGS
jgi:predicted nucleic acid-binding protein